MHASQRLRESYFGVVSNGCEATLEAALPGWTAGDRIGVVVHEPFGAIGASLLIQAAISRFYALDASRRDEKAQYPPVFMFHVGGRYGDHSGMDFWPARREVFLPADPYEVLGAVRDRSITRLLVPEGPDAGVDYAYAAPSGWTDIHSAQEQTASAYLYSASGRVAGPNLELTAEDDQLDDMVRDVLNVEDLIDLFERFSDQELLDLELGPSVPADFHGWLQSFKARRHEVPAALRRQLLADRTAAAARGPLRQTFRAVTVREAVGRLVPTKQHTIDRLQLNEESAHA